MDIYKPNNDMLFWKFKYTPKIIDDIDINKSYIYQIKKWLDDFDKNKKLCENKKINNKLNKIKTNKDDIDNLDDKDELDDKDNLDDKDDIDDKDDLDDFDNNDIIIPKKINNTYNKSNMLISGNHGVGKTSLITSILNSLGYIVYKINFIKINNFKNINEFINKTIFGIGISDKLNNIEQKKKIILIDNIECISSNNEKLLIKNLTKLNDINWYLPIILISNNEHNKLIFFVKKIAYTIQIYNPTNEILENILCKICIQENINLNDEKVLNKIIEYSHNDIRSLITILQSIKTIYGEKYFSLNDFDNFIKTCKMKDIDYHIFDGAQKLFFGYDNIDNVIRLFETEKTAIPLMIQQHYIDHLKNNDLNLTNKISKCLSQGDILENYIYENNIYDIRDIQSFYQCVFPSYILSNKLNPKKINYNQFNGYFTYPYDLNKTSIRHINYTKNIYPSNKVFKNMNINDFLYLNKIIRNTLISNSSNNCNEYFENYNCPITTFESLLKIDKINGKKYALTTKMKKKILYECPSIININKDNDKNKKNKLIKKSKKHK
jgi:hypothetical protein